MKFLGKLFSSNLVKKCVLVREKKCFLNPRIYIGFLYRSYVCHFLYRIRNGILYRICIGFIGFEKHNFACTHSTQDLSTPI
jgi:hypothetical protein